MILKLHNILVKILGFWSILLLHFIQKVLKKNRNVSALLKQNARKSFSFEKDHSIQDTERAVILITLIFFAHKKEDQKI